MERVETNKCWICGAFADSEEHKFKASLLRKHFGKEYGKNNPHLYISDNNATNLQSYNSKVLKFPKVICSNCNNNVTTKHDKAYDVFMNYISENYSNLFNTQQFDFKLIFGNNWREEKSNLYKYFAKHAGCKIVTGDYPYNIQNLSDFILKNYNCNILSITFVLKEGLKKMIELSNDKFVHIFNSHTICFFDQDGNNFGGWTSYQWISIIWIVSNKIDNKKWMNLNKQNEEIKIKYLKDCKPFNVDGEYNEIINNIEYSGAENIDLMKEYFDEIIY